MAMQEDWCTWRDCESSDMLSAENRAILRIFDRWDRFDRVMGGALFVENIIVAYTLAEPLTADTLVIHFEKGCPAYKGVYQAINQLFVARSAGGYPGAHDTDKPITGLAAAARLKDVMVFHAGTAFKGDKIVTSGGRVLGVTATGKDIAEAKARAYQAVQKIHFDGMHYRHDIGRKGLSRW